LRLGKPLTLFKGECRSPIGLESIKIQTNHWCSLQSPTPYSSRKKNVSRICDKNCHWNISDRNSWNCL